jgi:proton-translocating NADH-quinone oxidoreductase chain N
MELFTPIWLILIPLTATPLIYLGGRLANLYAGRQLSVARWLSLLTLLVTLLPFGQTIRQTTSQCPCEVTVGLVTLRFDGLSLLLAGLALGLGTLVVLYSNQTLAGEPGESKYYAILVAMVGMMIGLGGAYDLFNLWLWFEGMAISSYLLVAFYRKRPSTLEASVKYLVQSSLGSVLVLLAIALVFGLTGELRFDTLAQATDGANLPILLAAGGLFTIGFGVKIALVPLHTWLPDAHSQAPSGISAMLSGVVIEAGLVALLRTLSLLGALPTTWGELLMAFGLLNMVAGNLLALRQQQVKRLLAYSSLTHIGYMLVGLGIAIFAGETAGAQGGLFHLLNHGLMKGLAFLAAGALLYAFTNQQTSQDDHGLTIADLAGASRRYPLAALAFSLAVLGLAGLPPLAGFMSKWQIFMAGVETHEGIITAVILFAALNSVFSLAYYAPLINVVYRQTPSLAVQGGRSLPFSINLPLIILAAAIVVIGIWPNLLNSVTEAAAAAVMAGLGG